jgi:hypothetical protein
MGGSMNIGIIGCRIRDTQQDCDLVDKALNNYIDICRPTNIITIVSGGCPKGGDRFAEIIAKKYNMPILIHPAEWNKYGKSAGFKRNTYIARDSDVLIACVAPDRKGGTEDTIKKYTGLGKTRLILV